MLAVDKSLLNWKIVSFKKPVTDSPQHGDHLGHPKKIIYTFTSNEILKHI